MFRCGFEGLVAIALLLGGGLGSLQAIATGLPFALVLVAMGYSTYIGLARGKQADRGSPTGIARTYPWPGAPPRAGLFFCELSGPVAGRRRPAVNQVRVTPNGGHWRMAVGRAAFDPNPSFDPTGKQR